MTQPPNVVLIVLDTVRRDRVSAYGHERPTTPAFDSFAERATRFTDAVTQGTWSIPAHASLFTGEYPAEHGATTVQPVLRTESVLPALLSAAGYETYAVSTNEFVRPATGFGRGFDEFHTDSWLTVPDPLVSLLSPAVNWLTASPTIRRPLERLFNGLTASSVAAPTRHSHTGHRDIERILDTAGDPFFLFCNFCDAHLPRSPDPAYVEQFVDDDLDDVSVVARERAHTFGASPMGERAMRKMQQLYEADLRTMDDQFRDLIRLLRARGLLADSLVIVVSDHGEHLGEFGLLGHQHSVFDSVVSVPLAIQFPAGGPDRIDTQVETRRIFHTILDAAGVGSYPGRTLASGCGDTVARGAFHSPMLDIEQFLWDRTIHYDPSFLGESLSFVRTGTTKRLRFADSEWLFAVPERNGDPLSRNPYSAPRTSNERI